MHPPPSSFVSRTRLERPPSASAQLVAATHRRRPATPCNACNTSPAPLPTYAATVGASALGGRRPAHLSRFSGGPRRPRCPSPPFPAPPLIPFPPSASPPCFPASPCPLPPACPSSLPILALPPPAISLPTTAAILSLRRPVCASKTKSGLSENLTFPGNTAPSLRPSRTQDTPSPVFCFLPSPRLICNYSNAFLSLSLQYSAQSANPCSASSLHKSLQLELYRLVQCFSVVCSPTPVPLSFRISPPFSVFFYSPLSLPIIFLPLPSPHLEISFLRHHSQSYLYLSPHSPPLIFSPPLSFFFSFALLLSLSFSLSFFSLSLFSSLSLSLSPLISLSLSLSLSLICSLSPLSSSLSFPSTFSSPSIHPLSSLFPRFTLFPFSSPSLLRTQSTCPLLSSPSLFSSPFNFSSHPTLSSLLPSPDRLFSHLRSSFILPFSSAVPSLLPFPSSPLRIPVFSSLPLLHFFIILSLPPLPSCSPPILMSAQFLLSFPTPSPLPLFSLLLPSLLSPFPLFPHFTPVHPSHISPPSLPPFRRFFSFLSPSLLPPLPLPSSPPFIDLPLYLRALPLTRHISYLTYKFITRAHTNPHDNPHTRNTHEANLNLEANPRSKSSRVRRERVFKNPRVFN
ncbi:hypothetical protein C7M84_008532 [Penaeus vannamei]|uniref:Uncharacterized protein n=1 Tax=Penaeus vannamei TaxID=6689 RepID=A0A423T9H6_PENVA|nr:hypothetical protein C7M84_008532 [Penaeus vannamei]